MKEITSSSVKTFQTCHRKYFFSYVLLLKEKLENKNFLLGRNLHEQVEYFYTHQKMNEDFINSLPPTKESALLKGMLSGYAKKYSPDEFFAYEPEKLFSIPLPQFDTAVRGRLDAVVTTQEDEVMLLEYKTTSLDIEKFKEQMDNDLQPMLYIWAHYMESKELCDGMLYRVIKKPALRLKKTESEEELWQRLTDAYAEPEEYFHTFKVYKTQDEIAWFQDELQYYMEEMAKDRSIWPRNLQRCFDYYSTCPFMPLCQKQEVDTGLISSCYDKKSTQHEELIQEEIDV